MRLNPGGIIVLVLFFAILLVSLRSGPAATHVAEAIVTILILLGVGGFAFRNRPRRSAHNETVPRRDGESGQ